MDSMDWQVGLDQLVHFLPIISLLIVHFFIVTGALPQYIVVYYFVTKVNNAPFQQPLPT